jgi:RNA polymerase sigma-70 factor (ECF subfamily)
MDSGSEIRPLDAVAPTVRLEELFRHHYEAVAAYVARRATPDVVDDVLAETFLVAWRRLEDVPDHALPWLLGVARKIIATQRRAAARRRSLLTKLSGAHARPAASEPAADQFGVREALAELSEKDREALTLVAWDGLAPNEAAAVLEESSVVFRVRLHRAKRRLREKLERRARADACGLDVRPDQTSAPRGGT